MADQETMEQAVQRLARATERTYFGDIDSNFNHAVEAAIRQGIAWAYRDAAEISRHSAVAENGDYIHRMSKIARLNVAQDLERKAEEASRG